MGNSVVADPRPEVLTHIADPALGLAFGLRSVGMTEPGSVAVVAGEVEQAGMKDRLTAVVVTKPHRLGAVVEDFFGDAAVVMEGTLMTGEEKRQRLSVGEVEVHRARPAQRHDKALHPLSAWLLERAPVHLALLTGSRLETFRGLVRRHLTQWRHELFEDAAAAVVALLTYLVEEHLGVGHRILAEHARQQVLAEAVQLRCHLTRFTLCRRLALKQPANRLPVAAGDAGDFADALPLYPGLVDVHELSSADHLSRPPAAT